MLVLQLGVPAGLSAPYLIPRSDWIAIDDRGALVIEVQQIATVVEQYIPNYPDLLSACTAWRATTFPDLIAQAVTTNLFATNTAHTLASLSADLAGLTPSDPVPGSVKFIIEVQLQALAQNAVEQASTSLALVSPIAAFVSANQIAGAALEKTPLDGWSLIAGSVDSFERAMKNVGGSWEAIANQLEAAATNQIEITFKALLAIDFETVILGWTALANAAAAFDSMVAGLRSASVL